MEFGHSAGRICESRSGPGADGTSSGHFCEISDSTFRIPVVGISIHIIGKGRRVRAREHRRRRTIYRG